jgi:hypothetical protein
MKIRIFTAVPFLAALPAVCSVAFAQKISAIPSANHAAAETLTGIPLSFEINRGQSDANVKFLSHGNGYSLFLTESAAVLVLSKQETHSKLPGHSSAAGDVIRMELQGAKSNADVRGVDELPGKANYFIGNDPTKWHSKVPTYARVKSEGVYPGIDLVYYGNQRQLEYDFVVAPGADPKPLRLHFAGAQRLSLTPNGDLAIKSRNGEIAFHKPVVYQLKDGVREPVEGRFRLLAGNHIRFALGSYDHTRTLVIDPVLAYSTYLGGSGPCLNSQLAPATPCDSGNAIAVDAVGDFYVVGATVNSDFPVATGAIQAVNNGMAFDNGFFLNNAFVTKFNPRGSALIYSTYLGGTTSDEQPGTFSGDVATGVAVDAAGNAYVTGYASSYTFPVTSNAYQKVNNVRSGIGNNGFVTKLNPTGSALIYSTYFGGSGDWTEDSDLFYGENPAGIAIDAAGSAYIVGSTGSADLPVTSNAFQKVNNTGGGAFNLFITKFNVTGSALVYSTYLGGSGVNPGRRINGDTAGGIAIDSSGNAYVTGAAYSRDFPVTANAYQKINNTPNDPEFGTGNPNAIIAKLNPAGTALVYSTYLGGSTGDGANAIALDSTGNAYVTGSAGSPDFPVTANAFQVNKGGGFVTELNSAGSALENSTFFGGVVNSIALDAFGSAYLTGVAGGNFPVTADAFRKADHAPHATNAFVSKLDSTLSTLLYSTYIGGSATQGQGVYGDSGNGIAVDWFGDAYITGTTCSIDFPLASVPFQTKNKGTGCTAFVSKFIVNTVTGTALVSNSNPEKVGATATFTATVTPNMGTTVPTGSVVFSLDGIPPVTVLLDGSGQATYSNSTLAAGRYTITATYLGNATTSGSIAILGQLIIGHPARITVASGTYQTAVEGSHFAMPLVVQVQDARGVPVPGAIVNFSGPGLTFTGNPALTDAQGQASVIATATATGSLTATATTAGVSTPAAFRLTTAQPGP